MDEGIVHQVGILQLDRTGFGQLGLGGLKPFVGCFFNPLNLAFGHAWPGAPLDGLGRLWIAAPRQDDLIRLGQGRVVCVAEQVDQFGVVTAFVLGANHSKVGEHAGQHRQLGHCLGAIDVWLDAILQRADAELAGVEFGDLQLRLFLERYHRHDIVGISTGQRVDAKADPTGLKVLHPKIRIRVLYGDFKAHWGEATFFQPERLVAQISVTDDDHFYRHVNAKGNVLGRQDVKFIFR